MADAKGKSKSWPEIGTLRKGDNGSYIKLNEGIEVFLNGEKVPLNDKRTIRLEDPRKKVEGMLERGIISEAEADKRLEKLSELSWLKYSLIAPPPRD